MLTQGQSFGAISFFIGKPDNFDIISNEFTNLLMIRRDEFLNLLQESNADYEIFCQIKDNLLFHTRYEFAGENCYSCKSFGHIVESCHYLHLNNKKYGII